MSVKKTSVPRPGPEKTGRASPEAVEKRKAARLFNEALRGGGGPAARDGRTERRRKRLLKELGEGIDSTGKRELKPIDVLARVQELLDLGEPLASIRKACPPPRALEPSEEVVALVRRIHRAYGFAPAVYRFVGLDAAALRKAGVAPDEGPKPPAARRPGKGKRAA